MLNIKEAHAILRILEEGGHISGWEVHDDGPECDPAERYWGDIFVEEYSAFPTMRPDPDSVLADLALAALRIAIGRENRVAVVIKEGNPQFVCADDTSVMVAILTCDNQAATAKRWIAAEWEVLGEHREATEIVLPAQM